MEENKRITNVLLGIIVILVICGCVLAYFYFTKDKTKPIIDPEEKKTIENQEVVLSEEDYPRIDGAIATLPLAEAFKANFTGTDIKDVEVIHSKTHNAYVNLINGDTDLILVTYPSDDEKKLAQEKNVDLEIVPIVKEAFVFFVNKENIVDNLTLEQVQDIYSGRIKSWKSVGGESKKIIAYQKPENSESQSGMLSLVMKGKKMIDPITETISQGMTDIVDVISDYDNGKTSIGYSYYYYATTMYSSDTMKFLSINGIAPTYENIQTGLYDMQTAYYAVIRKDEKKDSNTRKLLELMKSERGQNVAKEAGYVQNY